MPKIMSSSYYPKIEENFKKDLLKKTTTPGKTKRILELIEEDKKKLEESLPTNSVEIGRNW